MKAIEVECSACGAVPGNRCSALILNFKTGNWERRTLQRPHRERTKRASLQTEAAKREKRQAAKAAALQTSREAQAAAVYMEPEPRYSLPADESDALGFDPDD